MTTDGASISSSERSGSDSVAISSEGSSESASATASMPVGSSIGSSPCTLITISASIPRAASASRSVPVAWAGEVSTASPPKPRTALAIRSSSVATITRSTRFAARARSYTLSIMVLPWISERGFPGRRVAA